MSQPTICLCMIVKNEEAIIADCIRSIPPDLYEYFIICDTGSTDKTRIAMRDAFIGVGHVTGEYHVHPWKNFGDNKTRMLEEASKSGRDWILMMDADHKFHSDLDTAKIKDMISIHKEDQCLIKMEASVEYRLPQLIRNNRDWKYVGVTHEYLDSSTPTTRGNFDGFKIIETDKGSSRADKFQRDVILLEEGLKQEPGNRRYLYYLAQSHLGLGNLSDALKYYRIRSNDKTGWEEERWHSEYKAVTCRELLERPEGWRSVVNDYVECFRGRPKRLEPLSRAVRICRTNQDYHLGWRLAAMGKINKPTDALFVEPSVYDWEFIFEAGICAYYAGDKKWFEEAMWKVIENPSTPDEVKTQSTNNLEFIKK